jgi:hypothetical protein
MNEELMTLKQEMELSLKSMMQAQIITSNSVKELTENYCKVNERLNVHDELFKKRIYFSSVQKLQYRKQIKDKVKSIVDYNRFNYQKASGILFQSIHRDINESKFVTSYHELPAAYYDEIIEAVNCWNMTESICERIESR